MKQIIFSNYEIYIMSFFEIKYIFLHFISIYVLKWEEVVEETISLVENKFVFEKKFFWNIERFIWVSKSVIDLKKCYSIFKMRFVTFTLTGRKIDIFGNLS